MKRLLAAMVLAAGLIVGPGADLAAAHHTHSPSVICNWLATSWNNQVPGSPYQVVGYTQYYDSTGHPVKARCLIRHNPTLTTHCRFVYYYSHGVLNC